MSPKVDAVTFSVISNSLINTCKEMTMSLLRAAYSTIIREASDASAALIDQKGSIVAQADDMPIHLNSMSEAFRGIMSKHEVTTLKPGEILITNDPFNGGQHLNDVFIFSPIHYEGSLMAFAGSVGHHVDIGGGGAGSMNPSALDVFSEGFVIPRLRLKVGPNIRDGLFGEIFAANIRVPHETIGDFNAQLAANRTGAVRLNYLFKKYGPDTVLACMEELIRFAEIQTREEIARLPEGEYEGQDILDDDGMDNGPFNIRVTVRIKKASLVIDFTGTDSQARGYVNAPLAATKAAVATAIKDMLTGSRVPANEGCNRPIEIIVPRGTILNPIPPAPVRARVNTCIRAFHAVVKALAPVIPKHAVGTCTDSHVLVFSEQVPDGYRVFTEPVRGGFGAALGNDGAVQCASTLDNCTNTPVEAGEHSFGFMRIRRYELLPDTQGFGHYCGAMGAIREYEILKDGVEFAGFSDRHLNKPTGIFGGHSGHPTKFVLVRDGKERVLPSKGTISLKKGDRFQVFIGAGGGYGDPKERDPKLVKRDLREGRISPRMASEIFHYPEESLKKES
jgi:N-methylhydantoinase B